MTSLSDVVGVDLSTLLTNYVAAGWLRQQFHDTEPLAILNYTEKTTFAKHWDRVTLNCRGLIYNTDTLEIVARPFPKFFNSSEENAAKFSYDEMVLVTDKKDGSMGILYRRPSDGEFAIATRGSFHSPQAETATAMFYRFYASGDWHHNLLANEFGRTLVFEIIYPENRIVLDYGRMEDLILLGAVSHQTGSVLDPIDAATAFGWPGIIAETLGMMPFGAALALPPRENAEGIVVKGLGILDKMVKVKQDDYIHLHRIITNLNARSVWTWMHEHDYETDGLKESLPEEFWSWVDDVAQSLMGAEADLWFEIENEYFRRVRVCGDRAQNARAFAGYEHAWALFCFLDEQYDRIHDKLWQMLKPDAGWSPHTDRPGDEE